MLIGPNGSGKTTLHPPRDGLDRADVRPRDLGRPRAGARRSRRAIVFQRPVMLRRSAAANIAYALAARVSRAANGARIEELLASWSALLDSATARRGGSPAASSSGSRSRVRSPAIRRCFFSTSRPQASIRPPPRRSRTSSGAVAARGIKVVMATHDLGEARRLAGEIVLLHRGRVLESGPARRIFRRAEDATRPGASSRASCCSNVGTKGEHHADPPYTIGFGRHRVVGVSSCVRAGQVDRRRIDHLDAGLRPVRPHPAAVQGRRPAST